MDETCKTEWSIESQVSLYGTYTSPSNIAVEMRAYLDQSLYNYYKDPKVEIWRLSWIFQHKQMLECKYYCNKEDAKELLLVLAPYWLNNSTF